MADSTVRGSDGFIILTSEARRQMVLAMLPDDLDEKLDHLNAAKEEVLRDLWSEGYRENISAEFYEYRVDFLLWMRWSGHELITLRPSFPCEQNGPVVNEADPSEQFIEYCERRRANIVAEGIKARAKLDAKFVADCHGMVSKMCKKAGDTSFNMLLIAIDKTTGKKNIASVAGVDSAELNATFEADCHGVVTMFCKKTNDDSFDMTLVATNKATGKHLDVAQVEGVEIADVNKRVGMTHQHLSLELEAANKRAASLEKLGAARTYEELSLDLQAMEKRVASLQRQAAALQANKTA